MTSPTELAPNEYQTPVFHVGGLTFSSFCRTISDKLQSLSSLSDGLGFLCCGWKRPLSVTFAQLLFYMNMEIDGFVTPCPNQEPFPF